MRIAVCDDNAVFLQFFKSMLANELESRSVKADIETFTKAESFFYCHGKKPFSAIFLDLDMPEMTGLFLVLNLGVRKRGAALGTPVDDAVAAVDQPFFVQADEHLAYRL